MKDMGDAGRVDNACGTHLRECGVRPRRIATSDRNNNRKDANITSEDRWAGIGANSDGSDRTSIIL
jgi:hypothetical protein